MKKRFTTRLLTIFLTIGVLTWLSACTSSKTTSLNDSQNDAENKNVGTLLIYSERDAGFEPFTTRIFVNKNYLHMSDSNSPADFVLLNRSERTIYSVTHDEKSILVIQDRPHDAKPPIKIQYKEESQPSGAIPKINGRQATHYRYFVNEKRCYDSVVIGGDFMPDVLAALREFRQVMANEHARSVNNTPEDMMDACDLAVNVFYATKHLDHGVPIREWDTKGYQRFLKDYRENISAPDSIFVLPKGYQRYSMSDAPRFASQ